MSKKCDECKRCAMNDDMTNVVMSSADWQRSEQRHLRREKRFVALIVLLVLLLVGSNMAWLSRSGVRTSSPWNSDPPYLHCTQA